MKLGIVFNTESAFWYKMDPAFRAIVDKSDFQLCDGAALALVSRWTGHKIGRYHGPDLMQNILQDPRYQRVFLLGGDPVAHRKIMGDYALEGRVFSGDTAYYHERLPEEALHPIITFRPDVVFVCLGLRKQERIAAQIKAALPDQPGLVVGVGAAIDFLGGTKVRSGVFFQRLGLEWLPRLIREPRMFVRIIHSLRALPIVWRGKVAIIGHKNFVTNVAEIHRLKTRDK